MAIEGTGGEGMAAKTFAAPGLPDLANNPLGVELLLEHSDRSEFGVPQKDEVDGPGLFLIDNELSAT